MTTYEPEGAPVVLGPRPNGGTRTRTTLGLVPQDHSGPLQDQGPSPDMWTRRLESAVANHVKKRTERSRQRMEMAERRAYGLMQRHAAKLARNRSKEST